MGIFKRVKRVVVADVNNLIDKVENPVSLTKQYLREIEEQIEKGKASLSQQYVTEKKYELLISEAEQTIQNRTEQAKLAVSNGEDEVAKIALQEKIFSEKNLGSYKEQLAVVRAKTTELTEQLQALQQKYDELKVKKNELLSRLNVATTLKEINETTSSFNADQAISGFARMEEKIWELEAAAKVQTQIPAHSLKPTVNPLVASEVEVELQKLKQNA
jgi:phage shock protein A